MRSAFLQLLCVALIALGFHANPVGFSNQPDNLDVPKERVILDALRVRQQELLRRFGANHPTVISIGQDIQAREERLAGDRGEEESVDPSPETIDQMTDQELRNFIRLLSNRVIRLEREVESLKNSPARVELLKP